MKVVKMVKVIDRDRVHRRCDDGGGGGSIAIMIRTSYVTTWCIAMQTSLRLRRVEGNI